jgi:hypothetical protein
MLRILDMNFTAGKERKYADIMTSGHSSLWARDEGE